MIAADRKLSCHPSSRIDKRYTHRSLFLFFFSDRLSELVFGKDVKLRPHMIDRYGRLVARVLVDGQDAALELLKEGLCWVYVKYAREAAAEIQTSYRDAQAGAQSGKARPVARPCPRSSVGVAKEGKRTFEDGADEYARALLDLETGASPRSPFSATRADKSPWMKGRDFADQTSLSLLESLDSTQFGTSPSDFPPQRQRTQSG
jgi:hypothetical protein